MRSLLNDIVTTLQSTTFGIANVTVRTSYSQADKDYPLIIVQEIDNVAKNYASVSGEQRSVLSYQIDIHTTNAMTTGDAVVNAVDAGRLLMTNIDDALDGAYKLRRRSITPPASLTDVVVHIMRYDSILDSYGYTYRN